MSLRTLASTILQFSGSMKNDMGMWGGFMECTNRYKKLKITEKSTTLSSNNARIVAKVRCWKTRELSTRLIDIHLKTET
ncbi:hypothetical protein V1478_005597 [Vespula squamosa]|uniref:Uncharacterized protein n=1 Tax=Vespula squamosa TaxID=30214 RepID=A0ABD2BAH1_VESSQ